MSSVGFQRNFGFLVHDIARLMRTDFDLRVKDSGLTRSQWWVLAHLLRNDGVIQSELAEQLDVGKASLGTLLDRLEAKGWIRREPDPNDRRAKRVFHTAKARPVLDLMNQIGTEMHRQALAGLSRDEQQQLVEMLIHVKANLLVTSPKPAAYPFAAAEAALPAGE